MSNATKEVFTWKIKPVTSLRHLNASSMRFSARRVSHGTVRTPPQPLADDGGWAAAASIISAIHYHHPLRTSRRLRTSTYCVVYYNYVNICCRLKHRIVPQFFLSCKLKETTSNALRDWHNNENIWSVVVDDFPSAGAVARSSSRRSWVRFPARAFSCRFL